MHSPRPNADKCLLFSIAMLAIKLLAQGLSKKRRISLAHDAYRHCQKHNTVIECVFDPEREFVTVARYYVLPTRMLMGQDGIGP
jgi:hypothetical protein